MSSPKSSRFITFANDYLEKYGLDPLKCRVQQKDGSSPQGGFVLHWVHDGKSNRVGLPHDLSNQGEIRIFERTFKGQLKEAGIELPKEDATQLEIEELKTAIKNQTVKIKELETEVKAATDLALEKAGDIESLAEEVKRITGAFQTILAVKAPEPTPQPIILAAEPPKATPPKLAPKPEQKPNGVEALEQVRRKLWAKVVEQMAEEFEPWDLKGRVLFFLEQCGPIEAHWLREAGVWEGLGQVVGYLEGLANEGLAFRLEKKWAITEAGKRLIEPEEEVVAPVPLPPAPFFQREAKPVYCAPVPEQPRLAVVPKIPEPVAQPHLNSAAAKGELSISEAVVAYLIQVGRPMSSQELKDVGLRGYGKRNDVATACYNAKKDGLIEDRGGKWVVTVPGRKLVENRLGALLQPVKNNDLRRQFVK